MIDLHTVLSLVLGEMAKLYSETDFVFSSHLFNTDSLWELGANVS